MADFPLGGAARHFSGNVDSANTGGVAVVSSATANTMGAIVELDASTAHEASGIYISVVEYASTANVQYMLDILIGGSGSEIILVEAIHQWSELNSTLRDRNTWFFPVRIPKGSRISARVQDTEAAANTAQVIVGFITPSFESHPGYSQVVSHNFNKANTNVTTAVDAGGTANTKGSWSEIASTSEGYEGFSLSIGANDNGGQANATWLIDIGVGAIGSEQPILENIYTFSTTGEEIWTDSSYYPIKIPQGTRIVQRCQCSLTDATDRLRSIVFHGVR